MADTVTGPTILQQNDKRVVIKIVNQSDGSGGTTVFGDVSALDARADGTAVAHLGLLRVWYSCQGGDGGDLLARQRSTFRRQGLALHSPLWEWIAVGRRGHWRHPGVRKESLVPSAVLVPAYTPLELLDA